MNKLIQIIKKQLCILLSVLLMHAGLPAELQAAAQKNSKKSKKNPAQNSTPAPAPAVVPNNPPATVTPAASTPTQTNTNTATPPATGTTTTTTKKLMGSTAAKAVDPTTCKGSGNCAALCKCLNGGFDDAGCEGDCDDYYDNYQDFEDWITSSNDWQNNVAWGVCNLHERQLNNLAQIQNYFSALGWAQTTLMDMNLKAYGTELLQQLPSSAIAINNYYTKAKVGAGCSSNDPCIDLNIKSQQKCLDLASHDIINSCFQGTCTYSGGPCTNDHQCPKKVCAIPGNKFCRTDSDCDTKLQDLFCNLNSNTVCNATDGTAAPCPTNICMSRIGTSCNGNGLKANNCTNNICDIDGQACSDSVKCATYSTNLCLSNHKCAQTGSTCSSDAECPNNCTLNDGVTPNPDLACVCLNPSADGTCAQNKFVCALANVAQKCNPTSSSNNADYLSCGYTGGLSCQPAPDEAASKYGAGSTVCLLSTNTDPTKGPITPAITANYSATTEDPTNGCIAQSVINNNNNCGSFGITVDGGVAKNITAQHSSASQQWFGGNNLANQNLNSGPLFYIPSYTPAFTTAQNMLQTKATIYSGPISPFSPTNPAKLAEGVQSGNTAYDLVCGRVNLSDDEAFNKITIGCTASANAGNSAGLETLYNDIATAANYLNPAVYNSTVFTPNAGTCANSPNNASAGNQNTQCPFAYPNNSATIQNFCDTQDMCTNCTAYASCNSNNKCSASGADCAYITCAGATPASCNLGSNTGTGLCNVGGAVSTTPCCQVSDCTVTCPNTGTGCNVNSKTNTGFCTIGTAASTIPCCQVSDCNCDYPNFCTAGTCNFMGNSCMTNSKGCFDISTTPMVPLQKSPRAENCSLGLTNDGNGVTEAPISNGVCINLDGTTSNIACCHDADCTCNYSYCGNFISEVIPGWGSQFALCLPEGVCSGSQAGCNIMTGAGLGHCINTSNPETTITSDIPCCSAADCTCQPSPNLLTQVTLPDVPPASTMGIGYDNTASPYAGIFGNGSNTMAYINCLFPATDNLGIAPEHPFGGPCPSNCTNQRYQVPDGVSGSSISMTCCGDCSMSCAANIDTTNAQGTLIVQGSCVGQSCAVPDGFQYDPISNPHGIKDPNTLCCNGTYCCTNETVCKNNTLNKCVYANVSTACPSTNSSGIDCIVTTYQNNPTTCPDPSRNPALAATQTICPNATGKCIDSNGAELDGSSCCNCHNIKCTSDSDCFVNYNNNQLACQNTYCHNPTGSSCAGICQPAYGPDIANTTPMSGATYDPTYNSICAQVQYAESTLLTNYYNQDLAVASYYAKEINALYQSEDYLEILTNGGNGTAYGSGATNLDTQCYNKTTDLEFFCEPLSTYAALEGTPDKYQDIVKGTNIIDMQAYINALQFEIMELLNHATSPIDGGVTGKPNQANPVPATDAQKANADIYAAILKASSATCTGPDGSKLCVYQDGTNQKSYTDTTKDLTCTASLDCINDAISALIPAAWGGTSTLKYLPFTQTAAADPNFNEITQTPGNTYLNIAPTYSTINYAPTPTLGTLTVPAGVTPANLLVKDGLTNCNNANCGNSNSLVSDCECTIFSDLLAPYGITGASKDPASPSFINNTPSLATIAATHATLINNLTTRSYKQITNWDGNANYIYKAYSQLIADYYILDFVYQKLAAEGFEPGASSCPRRTDKHQPQPITKYEHDQIEKQKSDEWLQQGLGLAGFGIALPVMTMVFGGISEFAKSRWNLRKAEAWRTKMSTAQKAINNRATLTQRQADALEAERNGVGGEGAKISSGATVDLKSTTMIREDLTFTPEENLRVQKMFDDAGIKVESWSLGTNARVKDYLNMSESSRIELFEKIGEDLKLTKAEAEAYRNKVETDLQARFDADPSARIKPEDIRIRL